MHNSPSTTTRWKASQEVTDEAHTRAIASGKDDAHVGKYDLRIMWSL